MGRTYNARRDFCLSVNTRKRVGPRHRFQKAGRPYRLPPQPGFPASDGLDADRRPHVCRRVASFPVTAEARGCALGLPGVEGPVRAALIGGSVGLGDTNRCRR